MPDNDIFSAYVTGLGALLTTPGEPKDGERAGEAARPLAPYSAAEIAEAERFLSQSQAVRAELWQRWQAAADDSTRSLAEVQLLGAAAADLAIAERLLSEMAPPTEKMRTRGQSTSEDGALIRMALTNPEALLRPAPLPEVARAPDQQAEQLKTAVWNCLEAVKTGAAKASKDAFAGLLAPQYLAILEEAAQLLGDQMAARLPDLADKLKLAVGYILAAHDKLRQLLGPEAEEQIKKAVVDLFGKVQDEKVVAGIVGKFLDTESRYKQSKGWIDAYQGKPTALPATTERIAALQGSFAGRVKIADVIVKGLAAAKLLLTISAVPPVATVIVAAAYLGVIGFVLYSAHDHVDSDRFPFFDRVVGVSGVLKADLGVASA